MIRKYFKPVEKEAPEASSKKRRVGDDVATSKGVTVTTETTGDQDIVVSAVEGQVVLEDTGATANVVSQKVTVTKDGVEEGVSEQQTSLTEEDVKTAKNLVAPKNLNPLLQLEYENMAPDWWKAFKSEMEKPYFLEIKRFLAKEKNPAEIYPIPTEIYSFTHCPLKKVKVVIIGQDPYHGPNQAHGLCFSVKKPERVPPSLKNIFDEITQDLGPDNFQRPDHGCLEGWSSEGVLLLNAALTVRRGQANSHAAIGWAKFTDAIISYINQNRKNVVFMLWGGFAQKKGAKVDKKKHLILKATHPSPLGANKGGWFGCKHFSKANEYLVRNGIAPVNWNHLP